MVMRKAPKMKPVVKGKVGRPKMPTGLMAALAGAGGPPGGAGMGPPPGAGGPPPGAGGAPMMKKGGKVKSKAKKKR